MDLYAGEQLLLSSGATVAAEEALRGKKAVALYFSAHWCPPCRQFTPLLRRAFQEYCSTSSSSPPRVGVVFVSSDRSLQDQLAYMRDAHGDWPAVPAASQLAQRLGASFGVRGIPALVVVSAADGAVITKEGRRDVMSMGAAAFAQWESQAGGGVEDVDVSVVDMLADNPEEVKKEAGEILVKLLRNVQRDPGNMKFRSVRLSNPKIETKLLTANGAFEILFSVGFEEGDDKLVLPLTAPMTTLEAFSNAIARVAGVEGDGAGSGAVGGASGGSAQQRQSDGQGPGRRVVLTVPQHLQNNPVVKNMLEKIRSEQEFYSRLTSERDLCLAYEERPAQAEVLKVVPVRDLEDKAKNAFERVRKADPSTPPATVRDLLLMELLEWFKEDFFSWVDSPECDSCGEKTTRLEEASASASVAPTEREKKDGARNVERYHCDPCGREVRFPRYHWRPAKLLETRRGRCGEWANCFALICRSLGFDVRRACDWTDHVWVEIWSEAEGRWVHADPCENAYDKPLVYEVGWGKKLTYVVATSKDETQDVTWRYSWDHGATRERRVLVRPGWLVKAVLQLTKDRQAGYSDEEKKRLLRRRLIELVELMKERDASKLSAQEQEGRQSGSLAWRVSRGEDGATGQKEEEEEEEEERVVWTLEEGEKEERFFHVEYDVVADRYVRRSAGDGVTEGWRKGAAEASDVFRKRESDWKMCYLARRAGTSKGSVTWEVDLRGTDLCVKSIELDVGSKTFEDGRVVWQLCGGATCLLPLSGSTLRSEALVGAKKVTLTATLSGGRGSVAWQHAQLFRAHEEKDKNRPQLRLLLWLKKEE